MTSSLDVLSPAPRARVRIDPPSPATVPQSAGSTRRPSWTRALTIGATAAAFGLGTLLIVHAYSEARTSVGNQHFDVFWAGAVLVLVSTLFLGTRSWLRARSAKVLLIAYGVVTFVPKFAMSVNGPVYYDEFGHFRHANDLLANGNLFNADPYLPIAKYYPGLSAVTVAVHEVTRLSIWHSGQLVIAAAHCSVPVTVFLIGRAAGLSQKACMVASIVYSLNPSYMYFDTQYAYESLALPLALFVVLACLRAAEATTRTSVIRWTVAGIAGALLCIVTHHLSSLFMGFVCLAMVAWLRNGRGDDWVHKAARRGSRSVALVALFGSLAWISFAAPETYAYVWPHVSSGLTGLVYLLLPPAGQTVGSGAGAGAQSAAHTLFAGSPAPLYERVAAFLSPVLVMIAVVPAAVHFWNVRQGARHRHSRRRSVAEASELGPVQRRIIFVSFGLTALYFASLPIALTSGGGEAAHRSWGYAYLGVAIVAGYLLDFVVMRRTRPGRLSQTARALLVIVVLVVCVGNISAGETVFYRFPGPYLFGTDTRSGTPELHQLALWMNQHLVPGSLVVTDRFTGEQIEAYTDLNLPSPMQFPVYSIYREGDEPSAALRHVLKSAGFRYFVVDRRIEGGPPFQGLFEGYVGSGSVNSQALAAMHSTAFTRLIYRTPNYEVFSFRL